MNQDEVLQFRTHIAERLPVVAEQRLSHLQLESLARHSSVEAACDLLADGLVVQLRSYVLAMPSEEIHIFHRWPRDWWQAFRERWFPKWWLYYWPVQYETIDIHKKRFSAVCPHLDLNSKAHELEFDTQSLHLRWMAEKAEEYEQRHQTGRTETLG